MTDRLVDEREEMLDRQLRAALARITQLTDALESWLDWYDHPEGVITDESDVNHQTAVIRKLRAALGDQPA